MYKLEVFFDYACPFCQRGHEYLKELHPFYQQIEIVWCPFEAHPRPDRYGPHSDLCIQGMFFALDHGVDIWAYHDRMFKAALKDRVDIEDINVLASSVRGLLNTDAFRKSLQNGKSVLHFDLLQLSENHRNFKPFALIIGTDKHQTNISMEVLNLIFK